MKKRYYSIFLIIIILLFSGCSAIRDTNGKEDISLNTITDADITSGDEGSMNEEIISTEKSETTMYSTDEFCDFDINYYSANIKKLNGVVKISIAKVLEGSSIRVTGKIMVDKGNIMVVLLDSSNNIIARSEGEEIFMNYTSDKTDYYSIALVGESFSGHVLSNRLVYYVCR